MPTWLSIALSWAKEAPWAIVLVLVGLLVTALGMRVSMAPDRVDALEVRVRRVETDTVLLGGLARVACLKTDRFTTEAAGLPCDSLLGAR